MEQVMQAMVMSAVGGPEVLAMREVAKPVIADPHQILVRVMAAGVNPADLRIRRREPPLTGWEVPAEGIILGLEGAGVVEAAGPAVTRFQPGDAVFYFDGGFLGTPGSYAQYKLIDARYAARKPARLSFAEAAALPVVAITGWEALHDHAGLARGETMLVQGGAGGLGHIGLQLGKWLGARVAATVSTPAKAEFARSLGADHAILYRNEDVAAAVAAWTGGEGVDVVYDTVGDAVFSQSIDLLRDHGRLVTAAYPTAWPTVDIFAAALRNVRIAFEAMGYAMASHDLRVKQTATLERVAALVDEGALHCHVDRVFPLAEAGAAQGVIDAADALGRIALEIPH